jgi:hypothetical protein
MFLYIAVYAIYIFIYEHPLRGMLIDNSPGHDGYLVRFIMSHRIFWGWIYSKGIEKLFRPIQLTTTTMRG